MATIVKKSNQEKIRCFYHITATNTTGRLRANRNGKTKVWKTRPDDFKIPVKYGMYDYFYIDQTNCHEWTID